MHCAHVLSHKKLKLCLAILDIDSLHLHEEIVPFLLDPLIQSIEILGYVKHPIIVDEVSRVVLDGVHRVAALEKMGCKRVPACLVDYKNPAIRVGCWYRTIKGSEALEDAVAQIKQVSDVVQAKEIDAKRVGTRPIAAAIKERGKAFYIHSAFRNRREAYDVIKRIEENLRKFGLDIGYESEPDSFRMLHQRKVDCVILTPKLSKGLVIRTTLSGGVFSHKATRHIFPARPMFVNVSLSLLRDESRTLHEINEELGRMLRKRRVSHVAGGSVNDGRRYEEDLYIFQ